MKVSTNNQYRTIQCWCDLPESVRPDFDYIEEDDQFNPRMIKYRNEWFDLNEFMPTREMQDSPLTDWHGYQSDSHFSGVVCRYSDDYGEVCMGWYIC